MDRAAFATIVWKILLVALGVLFALPSVEIASDDGGLVVALVLFGIALIPVGLAALRLVSYRRAVGVYAIYFVFFWSLLPSALHAIDRPERFWLIWAIVEAVIVGGILALFRRPKVPLNKTPESNRDDPSLTSAKSDAPS